MTDALLALIPDWGIWLIAVSVFLSCLALPVPSSILVMAAGGFAASGDLVLWQVFAAAFAGFVIGDQTTYILSRTIAAGLVDRARHGPRLGAALARAESLLERRGIAAVFLTRTVASPLGPYVAWLAGALRVSWRQFTLTAAIGAACWSAAYALIGHSFADSFTLVATLLADGIGIIAAAAVAILIGWYLHASWRRHRHDADAKSEDPSSKD